MPLPAGTDRQPYLIAGPPELVDVVRRVLGTDPTVTVLPGTGRPLPERIVVLLSEQRYASLASALAPDLVVEADAPIHPAS